MSQTLHGCIRDASLAHTSRTAFHYHLKGKPDGWQRVSYGEFLAMTEHVQGLLAARGAGAGDRVVVCAENRPGWPASYLGILMCGAQAVPADVRLTPPELRNIVTHSGAGLVIHGAENGEAVREACEGLDVELLDMEAFTWERPVPPPPMAEADGEEVASLIYTSGTTGEPKAVMLTHGNFLSDADAVLRAGIVRKDDTVLGVLPLHHTYPFMCTFVVPMLLGARVTYPAGLGGQEIAAAVRETGVSILVGVPQLLELMRDRMYERLREAPLAPAVTGLVRASGWLRRRMGPNLMGRLMKPLGPQFRYLTSGGARLDPRVMTDLEALGFTVLEGYGLTETSPIVAFNPPARRKPGSAGKALPPAEIAIREPGGEGREKKSGEGEISIRGPMVMRGYLDRPEETGRVLRHGWFLTGDLGYLDGEGYLFITGRAKEVMVLASGKNVYPEEVEKHYAGSPLIGELCVMEDKGRLRAVIVPDVAAAKERGVGNLAEAIRWEVDELSQGLPPHMRVKGFALRKEPLPRTPLGKLRRFLVAGKPGGEAAPPPEAREDDAALLADPVGRAVSGRIKALVPERTALRAGDSLELDLGLDSLMRVELAASLERVLGMGLPEEDLARVHTVGELVEAVRARGAGGEPAGGPAPAGEPESLADVLGREPTEDEKRRVGLRRAHLEWPLAALLTLLLRLVLRIFFRLEVRGVENLPAHPFIVAPNHVSYMDGFCVGAGVPLDVFRGLFFQGVRRYFEGPVSRPFARLAHVIPIDPDTTLASALQLSAHVLRTGRSLCIFPEGGRSFDGQVMPFRKGIGILALALGVPVVPAAIEGTFEALPRGRILPRPRKIRITFGPAVHPAGLEGVERPHGVDESQFLADKVRKEVLTLLG